MSTTQGATTPNNGQLTPDQFSEFLNSHPDLQEQFRDWQKAQSDSVPPTEDTATAEREAEREKEPATITLDGIDAIKADSERNKAERERKAQAIREIAEKNAKKRKERKEKENHRKKDPIFGPLEQRVVLFAEGEWRDANGALVGLPQTEQICTGALFDHEKSSYWIPDAEDKWIKVNESGVRNHLNLNKGVPKVAPKDPETDEKLGPNPMDEAMDVIVRTANV
jgi:hypothetical protein